MEDRQSRVGHWRVYDSIWCMCRDKDGKDGKVKKKKDENGADNGSNEGDDDDGDEEDEADEVCTAALASNQDQPCRLGQNEELQELLDALHLSALAGLRQVGLCAAQDGIHLT